MSGVAGRSTGFGRIGGDLRPSPYTPVHLASTPHVLASRPAVVPGSGRPLTVAALVVLVLVAAALGTGLLVKWRSSPDPVLKGAAGASGQVEPAAESLECVASIEPRERS